MATSTTTTKKTMPAKPKYKPMPKAPEMKDSVKAWQNYEKRCKAVIKYNLAKKEEYDKKVKAIKSVADAKKRIRQSIKRARKNVPFGKAE